MKKRITAFLLAMLLMFALLPACALADTGPKPYTSIKFAGFDGERYFVTLLAEDERYGPWGVDNEYADYMGDKAIWEKFSAYSDPDGFFFWGEYEECTETDSFKWSYYPPETFKILIYFPESDSFTAVPGIHERFAFASFFNVDGELNVTTSYEMSMQLWQLLLRIVLTIGIEILVALWFGFRAKKQLITITVTNVITQVLLNVALFVLYLKRGAWAYIGWFIPLELAVFVIEAVTYKILLPRYSETEKEQRPVLYAFVANLLSMLLGGLIVFLCR